MRKHCFYVHVNCHDGLLHIYDNCYMDKIKEITMLNSPHLRQLRKSGTFNKPNNMDLYPMSIYALIIWLFIVLVFVLSLGATTGSWVQIKPIVDIPKEAK